MPTPDPTPDEVIAARARIARDVTEIGVMLDGTLARAQLSATPAARALLKQARADVARLAAIIVMEFELRH